MSALPFSAYDVGIFCCPLCHYDNRFCICEEPTVPPTPAPAPKPAPRLNRADLIEQVADLTIAVETLARGSEKRWRNEAEDAGLAEARRILAEMREALG